MKLERAGKVRYSDLDPETQIDVAYSIGFKTGEIRREGDEDALEDVKAALEKGATLPLVWVNPSDLLHKTSRGISRSVAQKYARVMLLPTEVELMEREGIEFPGMISFPPIVIDSSSKKNALLEGGHRTLAAKLRGAPVIKAVDIAGVRLKRVGGLATYAFPR